MRPLLLLAALFALAAPASAQRPSYNDRVVERAVDDMGVDYRQVRDAAHRAFSELYPDQLWNGYRLNETQARAVAYIAVEWVMGPPVPGGGNGWPPDQGQYPPQGGGYPPNGNGYGTCGDAGARLYDLVIAIPSNAFALFLSGDEKARIVNDLGVIGRMASECGCRPLADGALDIVRSVNGTNMVDRSDTVEALDRLRVTADSCR